MQLSPVILLIVSFLVTLSGFSSIRRPLQKLIEFDPIGKFILQARGEAFTRKAYRVFGVVLVAAGIAGMYLSLARLQGN